MKNIYNRPLMSLLLSVVLSFFISSFLQNKLIIIFAVIFALFAILILFIKHERKYFFFMVFISLCLSMFYFALYNFLVLKPCEKFYNNKAIIFATVESESFESSNSKYFDAKTQSIKIDDKEYNEKIKIRVYYNKFLKSPNITTKVRLDCKIYNGEGKYYDYYKSNNIFLTAYASDIEAVSGVNENSFTYKLNSFQATIKNLFKTYLPSDVAAFSNAIIVSDKSQISDEIIYSARKSGVSHILVVSGLHFMYVIAFFVFIMTLFGVPLKIKSVISIILSLIICAITGFQISCIRAAIMVIVCSVALLFDKQNDSLTALAIAIFLLVIFTPYKIRNISLLLSVCSSAGIIILYPKISHMIMSKVNIKNRVIYNLIKSIVGIICVTLCANIGVLPILFLTFGEISIIGLLTNVIITLPFQIMLICCIILLLGGSFINLGFLSYVITPVYHFIIKVILNFAKFDFATIKINTERFYAFFILLLLTFILMLILKKLKKEKFYLNLFIGFVAAYFAFCIVNLYLFSGLNKTVLNFCDVGQGDSAFISKNRHAIIFDCGGADFKIENLYNDLDKSSVKTVDAIIISHFDADHFCFADEIIANYDVKNLIFPKSLSYQESANNLIKLAKMNGINIIEVDKDIDIDFKNQGVKVKILTKQASLPSKISGQNENSIACIAKASNKKILFTGDIESKNEYLLLRYNDLIDCDILKIAHHGSKTSSSDAFLKAVSPEISIISGNKDNKILKEETLNRIKKYSNAYITEEKGSIKFYLEDQK